MSDERPFFGEPPEVLGDSLLPWTPEPSPESHTPAVWRELKIADGLCPLPGCGGTLDADFFCATCGQVSLPKPAEDVVEDVDEYLPRLPLALEGWPAAGFPEPPTPVDEYAEADVA